MASLPALPPLWWMVTFNASRRARGLPELRAWDPLPMLIWSMVSDPPRTPQCLIPRCL